MAHARQQIRDYVKAALTGLTTTADRVYTGRARPLAADALPTLLIYTPDENVRRAVHGRPPGLERPMTLHIEGRVSVAMNVSSDDLLDDIAAEVETAIAAKIDYAAAVFFEGKAQNVELLRVEQVAKAEGEKDQGGIRLTYSVTYCTVEGAPSVLAVAPDEI
jgi:hypothetical protein